MRPSKIYPLRFTIPPEIIEIGNREFLFLFYLFMFFVIQDS